VSWTLGRGLPGAGGQAGASHALAQAAFSQEILFEARNLPVEQKASQLDQPYYHIGANDGIAVFDAFAERFVVGTGLAVEVAQAAGVGMVGRPLGQAAEPEEIAVILEEFFEAGTATFVSLISISLEVPEAWLPSTMFCFPERAACTIWS
jgi:hypothetical protein